MEYGKRNDPEERECETQAISGADPLGKVGASGPRPLMEMQRKGR